jgi:hypothetical protein
MDPIKEVAIVAAYPAGIRTPFVAKQFGVHAVAHLVSDAVRA